MCGLVGIATSTFLSNGERAAFKDLLFVDTLRGEHSTGVFSVDTKSNVDYFKQPIDGPTFIQLNAYNKLFDRPTNLRILAGHNRKATVGKVNYDNAHPFNHGEIIMMHNGTLKSQGGLEKAGQFGTDSECIAYNLSQVEPDNVEEVINKLNGAFALVWWDNRDETLNFIRNSERTLYVGQSNSKRPMTISWASEASFLNLAHRRPARNLPLEQIDLLKPLHHYKVDLSGSTVSMKYLKKYEGYTAPKSKWTPNTDTGRSTSSFGNRQGNEGTGNTSKKSQGEVESGGRVPPKPPHYPKNGDILVAEPVHFENYRHDENKGRLDCLIEVKNVKGETELAKVSIFHISRSYFDAVIERRSSLKVRVRNVNWLPDQKDHVSICVIMEEIEPIEGSVVIDMQKARKLAEGKAQEKKYKEELALPAPDSVSPPPRSKSDKQIEFVYQNRVKKMGAEEVLSYINGPKGELLTYPDFRRLAAHGCSLCTCDLRFQDADSIVWEDDNPFCAGCAEKREAGIC